MSDAKRAVNLYLPDDLVQRLRVLAQFQDRSVSAIVIDALNLWLSTQTTVVRLTEH